MPSSPLTRRSPTTELKVESAHKRGHSFEGKYSPKPKDDDLLLFNEVQNRERENFLLHSFDDFDESISKLKYFSGFSHGITIPARTERSDLLDADGEKNDYDWLLTPPDTPLFPSLDDDVSQSANASRGRTKSQPIPIPNISMSARPNRSSKSPHRLSSSPKSNYGVSRPRSRSSSVPRSSPPPILRAATPSRGPSTPPTKPSSSTQLFLAPQRMSTGSSVQTFTSKRGMPPAKVNRGNSASPKLRGWQSNLPGFSTDVPPNLRTSLTDQPATRLRGSSPVSGNRRGSVPKYGRQSLSPSSSRSTMSLRNSEGDEFSSISKPSTTSSHEDDAQSHASPGVSLNATTRKCRDFAHNRAMGFSNKPSGAFSASSAPKRSFDFARRQMDHHRTPQNMFRPLLSSVPASTFYSAKTNSVHGPMLSRNSSLTTSSNASSDQGASFALDLEDTDHDQSDLAGKWDGTKVPGFQEEIFVLDKLDEVSEDTCHEIGKCQSSIGIFDESMSSKVNSKLDNSMVNDGVVVNTVAYEDSLFADEVLGNKMSSCLKCGKYFDLMDMNVCQECLPSYCLISSKESETDATSQDINFVEKSNICLKCGKHFTVMDMVVDVCQECYAIHGSIASKASGTRQIAARDDPNDTPCHEIQRKIGMSVPPNSRHHSTLEQHEQISERPVTDFSMDSRIHLMTHNNEKNLSEQEIFIPNKLNDPDSCCKCESPQSLPTLCSNDRVEGMGIAILLTNASSSRKQHIVRGNSSVTNILFMEPSDGVDIHIMKHSLGKGSSSSSSVELGPSEQTDMLILHQLSNIKDDMDNVRCDCHITSHSDLEKFSAIDRSPYNDIETEDLGGLKHTSSEQAAIGTDESCYAGSSLASSGILLQLGEENTLQMHDSLISGDPGRSCISYRNMDDICMHNNEGGNNEKMEKLTANQDAPLIEDNYMVTDKVCEIQDEISDVVTSSLPIVTLDQRNEIVSCQDAEIDCTPAEMTLCVEGFLEDCISITLDKDVLPCELESKFSQDLSFEEPVTIESPKKQVQRCFTLEEATDTILFCSSIVHDIAYKAASIAVDKEFAVYDSLHQPITFLGNTTSNHKKFQKASSGRTRSPQRVKRKKQETADKMTSIELTKNVANSEITSCNNKVTNTIDSVKPPKLESKCNCTVM